MEVKYYVCKHCGNIIEKVKDKGASVICCGEAMQELRSMYLCIRWKAIMFMLLSERQNIQCLKSISLSGSH